MEFQSKFVRAGLIGFFLLVLVLGITKTTQAQGLIYGEAVPEGDLVEKDIFLNGKTIRIEGEVDGDVLAIGNTVIVEGAVTGSLVIIGGEVILSGDIDGSVYAIAGTVDLISDTQIGRSLYAVALFLGVNEGAEIGRDLFGVSLSANLAGSIGRDTRVIIGLLEIGRIILESINLATTGKPIDEVHLIPDQSDIATNFGGALFSIQRQTDEEPADSSSGDESSNLDWLFDLGRSLIVYLIVGLTLLWLRPIWVTKWSTALRKRPFAGAGIGMVVYIIGFMVYGLLLIIVIAISLGLILSTLWQFGFILGGMMFSALHLAFFTFVFFVAYISKIIVAYLVGYMILERVYPQALKLRLWPFLLGLGIYLIICAIPILGWAAALIATFLGLGAVWMVLMNGRRKVNDSALEPAG